MRKLEETVNRISPISSYLGKNLQNKLDNLTKPKGSLGRLEEMAKVVGMIKGSLTPIINRKVSFVFASDHGVVEEKVSAFPPEVTAQMVYNFLRGGAGINVLANLAGSEVIVVDIGVKEKIAAKNSKLKVKKINYGTKNMSRGPAMSREEAVKSVEAGIEVFEEENRKGKIDIVGIGDMGIGNTTASSAITACVTSVKVEDVTSKGTGIGEEMLKNKFAVIRKSLDINKPDSSDPIDILSKVGGFEIGGMAGVILSAAANNTPVILDGFISTAGALIAAKIAPESTQYMIASHQSVEKGHKVALNYLGKKPLLNLDLRLGEGTGAALAMILVEAGIRILNEMASFQEAKVSQGEN